MEAKFKNCKYRDLNCSILITVLRCLIREFFCYPDVNRMSKWALHGVDFRSLISFKNHLFNCRGLTARNCIPVSEYYRIRNQHDDAKIRADVCGTESIIMWAITVEENPDLVDLNAFSDLIDCYVYYPVKESVKDQ